MNELWWKINQGLYAHLLLNRFIVNELDDKITRFHSSILFFLCDHFEPVFWKWVWNMAEILNKKLWEEIIGYVPLTTYLVFYKTQTVYLLPSNDTGVHTDTQIARLSYNPTFIFSLLSLFWKNKNGFMRSPCCLCLCESTSPPPPPWTFERLNHC
jgi:hypothetical protein